MAAFPRNLMNDIIVPFTSSVCSFYRALPRWSGINERVSSRRGRRGDTHNGKIRRPPRSEITFPRGRIVSAIYQSRCRTIKQRLGIRERSFPRRIERIDGRSISTTRRNIRPTWPSSNDIPSLVYFQQHMATLSMALSLSFPLSLVFSPADLRRSARSTCRQVARGSLSLGNASAVSANENRRSGKQYKRIVHFVFFSLSMRQLHISITFCNRYCTQDISQILHFFYLYRYFEQLEINLSCKWNAYRQR